TKDAHAKAVAETIKRLAAEGCSPEWSPHDSLAQAMNKPEHRGHIRMLGAGFTKSQVFGTAAAGGRLHPGVFLPRCHTS
ncbi:hypothetical protein LINPERPRIM_LOCUS48, partial [Linum perenne]